MNYCAVLPGGASAQSAGRFITSTCSRRRSKGSATWTAHLWSGVQTILKKFSRERMRTYESQTAPVVEHYRALGRFEEVDGISR